jgi:hypothetical protein
MLRLFVFRQRNPALASGSALAVGKGPRSLAESPWGGSTVTTSAPKSASNLVQKGPATPVPYILSRHGQRVIELLTHNATLGIEHFWSVDGYG